MPSVELVASRVQNRLKGLKEVAFVIAGSLACEVQHICGCDRCQRLLEFTTIPSYTVDSYRASFQPLWMRGTHLAGCRSIGELKPVWVAVSGHYGCGLLRVHGLGGVQ